MARVISCPSCAESEDLDGRREEEGIRIVCGRCGASWLRDSTPDPCATCGSAEVEVRPQAMTQYARGTQVSIVGFGHAPLCVHCDAEMLSRIEGRPIPNHDISAASKARDGGPGGAADTTILSG